MSKKLLGWTAHYDDGTQEKFRAEDMITLIKTLGLNGGGGGGGRYTYINADECPTHGPWRAVPAGTSKSTGKPYPAFWACDQEQGEERCTNKPSRDWVETHPPDRADDDFSQKASEPTAAPAQSSSEFDDLPW